MSDRDADEMYDRFMPVVRGNLDDHREAPAPSREQKIAQLARDSSMSYCGDGCGCFVFCRAKEARKELKEKYGIEI